MKGSKSLKCNLQVVPQELQAYKCRASLPDLAPQQRCERTLTDLTQERRLGQGALADSGMVASNLVLND